MRKHAFVACGAVDSYKMQPAGERVGEFAAVPWRPVIGPSPGAIPG
jgi:hypothetical protein